MTQAELLSEIRTRHSAPAFAAVPAGVERARAITTDIWKVHPEVTPQEMVAALGAFQEELGHQIEELRRHIQQRIH